MPKKRTILLVQGGCGDVIAATPMLRAARKALPNDEIMVLSTYSRVLKHNPNIDILIDLSSPDELQDFYSQFVLGNDIRFFKKFFPYDHIMNTPAQGCKTLREFITNLYGFREFFDSDKPDYFVTEYEKRAADAFVSQDKKPIVLLHIYGAVPSDGGFGTMLCGGCAGVGLVQGNKCPVCSGAGKLVMKQKTNSLKDLNPEIVAPIVKQYKDKYNFLQIGLDGEPLVPGVIDCLGMPLRDTIALLDHPQVVSFIFIESLFMHAAAALGKRGVVVFQNTDPEFFGYDGHFRVWDSGGCKLHPCNRPVGALFDFYPGYTNPKDPKSRILWKCKDQVCSKISVEQLQKVFEESIGIKPINTELLEDANEKK